jgi:hypothetical protein
MGDDRRMITCCRLFDQSVLLAVMAGISWCSLTALPSAQAEVQFKGTIFDFSDLDAEANVAVPQTPPQTPVAPSATPETALTSAALTPATVLAKLQDYARRMQESADKSLVEERRQIASLAAEHAKTAPVNRRAVLLDLSQSMTETVSRDPLVGRWIDRSGRVIRYDLGGLRANEKTGSTFTWYWLNRRKGCALEIWQGQTCEVVQYTKGPPERVMICNPEGRKDEFTRVNPTDAEAMPAPLTQAMVKLHQHQLKSDERVAELLKNKRQRVATYLMSQAKELPALEAVSWMQIATDLETGTSLTDLGAALTPPPTGAPPASRILYRGRTLEFLKAGVIMESGKAVGRWDWIKVRQRAFVLDLDSEPSVIIGRQEGSQFKLMTSDGATTTLKGLGT